MKNITSTTHKLPVFAQLLLLFILLIIASSALIFLHSKESHAASLSNWVAGNIMDDVVMTNKNTMGVGQIQTFLNSKVPTCDTNGLQTSEYAGGVDYNGDGKIERWEWGKYYYNQTTFPCLKDYIDPSTGLSSAQTIYNVSQKYAINPEVLIVLLQKEQGLVTDTWPLNVQYRTATGYGCPDTATCDSTYYGLTNQLTWSATMFRAIQNNSSTWYSPYVLGNNYIQYNPNTACSGTTVNIQNRATQSLYDYTPYQPNSAALLAGYGAGDSCSAYGNRNFYLYFTDWFGPTTGTKILKKDGDTTFYVYSQGQKTPIPNYAVYQAYGFDKIAVTIGASSYIDSLPTTAPLTNLSRYSNGTVELINNGYRYNLSSLASCQDWGYSCSDPSIVNTLDDDLFSTTTWLGYLQPLMYNNGSVYKMKGGLKEPFLNMDAVVQNGYNYGQISSVVDSNAQQGLGPLHPSEGVSFKLANGGIMVYTKGQYIAVSNPDMFNRWNLGTNYYPSLPASSWDTTLPTATSTLSDYFIQFGTTKLLIDNGRKIDLSASFNNWPTAATANPYLGNLLNRLPLVSTAVASCFQSSNGDLLVVENSQRRSIRLVDDLYELGCNPNNLIGVNENSLSMLSSGPAKLTHNRLFKVSGQDAIYMETSPTSSVQLPSLDYVNAFGQKTTDIATVDSTTLATYSPQGSVRSIAGNAATGSYFVYTPNETRYYFNSSVFDAWGMNKQAIPTYDNKIGSNENSLPATLFARTSDGSIYYGQQGSRHLITSYAAFIRLGGSSGNVMNVLNDFVNVMPTGSNINA